MNHELPKDGRVENSASSSSGAYEQLYVLVGDIGHDDNSYHARRTRRVFRETVEKLTRDVARLPGDDRERVGQFIRVLRTGLDLGLITVETMEDLSALHIIMISNLRKCPHVVEYYAKSGDLMEMAKMFLEFDRGNNKVPHQALLSFRVGEMYCYEVFAIEKLLRKGGDAQDIMGLPMEVRATFARSFDAIESPDEVTGFWKVLDYRHDRAFARHGYSLPWKSAAEESEA